MMDYLNASRIARMEHEERVTNLLREEQLLNDTMPEAYETWVTRAAPAGRIPHVGEVLSMLSERVVSLGNRLRNRHETTFDKPITGQKRRTMVG